MAHSYLEAQIPVRLINLRAFDALIRSESFSTYALDVSADDLLVENLTRTSSPVGQELHGVLQDCNHDEKEMFIRLLKFMKELFREFSI